MRRLTDHEPRPDPADVYPYAGDDDIVAAGFTDGGFPFGVTVREWREGSLMSEREAGWACAKRAFEDTFAAVAPPGGRVEVGWVSQVGRGLSRSAYAARVDVQPDPHGLSGDWTALVPLEPPSRESLVAEIRMLDWLAVQKLAVRVPTPLGARGGILIRSFLPGIPLDPNVGSRWRTVAEVAAAVHALAPRPWLPGFPTRRAHAVAALCCLDGHDDPVCVDALAWASAHLPEERPACLLHGDLLGQNILLPPDGPPALIDWEFAQSGDPAYDLAIVTRGVRRPFKMEGGLERFVEAYAKAGGADGVTVAHVQVFELAMLARWYVDSLAGGTAEGPEAMLGRVRGFLRRLG
jgi:hypothetical protein